MVRHFIVYNDSNGNIFRTVTTEDDNENAPQAPQGHTAIDVTNRFASEPKIRRAIHRPKKFVYNTGTDEPDRRSVYNNVKRIRNFVIEYNE